jgi:prepilin-type N-terminal cleavage/methylation domain-containing protein
MRERSQRGFTLIEMMVVISIIGILMYFLLPGLIGATERANQMADQSNLSRGIFQAIRIYHDKHRNYPPGGGHKFLLGPWIDGDLERTEKNRDIFFTPGLADDYYTELKKKDLKDLWRRREELTSMDTHYAGRASKFYAGLREGKEAWAANDNEFGRAFADGTIHVLMGDGSVKALHRKDDLEPKGWPEDDDDYTYPVGPESPHPLLQKLEK